MRKKFLLVYVLILIFGSFNLIYSGETGKISGKAIDKANKEPLLGASIVIIARWEEGVEKKIPEMRGASTNMDGDFFILNVPPGLYSVKASYVGYRSEVVTLVKVDVDKTSEVNFFLETDAVQGKEVVVSAFSAKKVEPDITATKQVYTIADVSSTAGIASVTDILELQADVIDDHFRGGRIGQSSYLIGGASINNPLSNQRSFSPMVTGLQQVEVYTSGFSAEYGNAQSGVVNMVAKEGGEAWETRLEASSTMPRYRSFGGSVYDTENLPFYGILSGHPSAWFAIDPSIGKPAFTVPSSIISGFTPGNMRDSLALARLTQITWLQGVRRVGLDYGTQFDTRLDFSAGGPLAEGMKMFIAARQNIENPTIPTSDPNVERQIMSNITYQAGKDDKLKFNFILANQADNYLDSGWLDWMFNPTTSVTQRSTETKHYGLNWNHFFSNSTFMDAKLNVLNVTTKDQIEIVGDDEYTDDYTRRLIWPNYTDPSLHRVLGLQSSRGSQKLITYDLQASVSSQLNKFNLLKAGLQFTYYDLKVDQQQSIGSEATVQKIVFNNYPMEGALYLQDKMEFIGFIANIGLRFDFYDMNTDYYLDTFSPLRNPNRKSETGTDYYNKDFAAKGQTKLYTRLQPRIGISFPLSETSVFHLNYGTFTQRPSFTQIYYNQISFYNDIQFIGNPLLKPENTRAYDIGLVNAFPYGIKLDVSAYYKDVTNLIEVSNYEDEKTQKYKTYTNREYADIKGFIVNLEKSEGSLKGYIRYNYESAKGKNSNDLTSPVTFSEIAINNKMPDPEDVFLDYDRSHKAIFNLSYRTSKKDGFKIGSIYPLGRMSLSLTYRIYSGRPYTFDASGQGLKYNMRTPTETDLRVRLEKTFSMGDTDLLFYLEGFNLLNSITYNYSRVFTNDSPTSANNLTKWHRGDSPGFYPYNSGGVIINNREEDIRLYDEYAPYLSDQSASVISNQPRYFRLGVTFKF